MQNHNMPHSHGTSRRKDCLKMRQSINKKATAKRKCSGELLYYEDNLFTYFKVSDQFSKEATKILAKHGFEEALSLKTPESPRIHISVRPHILGAKKIK